MDEIKEHQKQISLLKEKLHFKEQIENMDPVALRPPQFDIRWEQVDYQMICGLGYEKTKKDIEETCSIF